MLSLKECTCLVISILISFACITASCTDDDDDDVVPTATPTLSPTPTPTAPPSVVQLTIDEEFEMYPRQWPDGSKVLFNDVRDDLHSDLATAPMDGSMVKTVISPGTNTYQYADIHPAGTHICYSTGADNTAFWEIAVLAIGGSETIITHNEATYGCDSHLPVFNGDGTKIAYVRRDWNTSTETIVVIDMDGTNEQIVCTLPSHAMQRIEGMDWLGNENSLIYTNQYNLLYMVDAQPGAVPQQIGTDNRYHVCTSKPDGSVILCAESIGTNQQQYVTLHPDGSNKQVVVSLDQYTMFSALYCQTFWLHDLSGIIGLATDAAGVNTDLYRLDGVGN